ncbi:MAG: hypothetical protein QM804_16800 [Propionicimonas sp.]
MTGGASPHRQKASARGEQPGDLGQGLAGVEVVQDSHHGHQVDRLVEIGEVRGVDRHVRQPRAAGGRLGTHGLVKVGAVHLVEARCELGHQPALPAADVDRGAPALRQVSQDPRVEVVVVTPRMAAVEPG